MKHLKGCLEQYLNENAFHKQKGTLTSVFFSVFPCRSAQSDYLCLKGGKNEGSFFLSYFGYILSPFMSHIECEL